jgi:hypothetical protein
VLRELSPLLEQVHGALEGGMLKAREYFDSLKLRTDADLAPNIVRFHAKQTLTIAEQSIPGKAKEAFSLRNLPNNGLMLNVDIYKLRILKVSTISEGKLPAPGYSRMRQIFWNANRQLVLALEFPSGTPKPTTLNLLVLWETDTHFNLSKLHLLTRT